MVYFGAGSWCSGCTGASNDITPAERAQALAGYLGARFFLSEHHDDMVSADRAQSERFFRTDLKADFFSLFSFFTFIQNIGAARIPSVSERPVARKAAS
jgi:hypothetical protein